VILIVQTIKRIVVQPALVSLQKQTVRDFARSIVQPLVAHLVNPVVPLVRRVIRGSDVIPEDALLVAS
jgi:hypothetical protein